MTSLLSRLISTLGIILLAAPQIITVHAADGTSTFKLSEEVTGSGSQYITGNYPGAILMPVSIWGSAVQTGIHHVPTDTDLLTFLTLIGGPGSNAILDEILIRRRMSKEETILEIDLQEILETPGSVSPKLKPNDIIIIQGKEPMFDANLLATMGFVASSIGLILAGFALSDRLSR